MSRRATSGGTLSHMLRPLWQYIVLISTTALAALGVVYVGLMVGGTWYDNWSGYTNSGRIGDGVCNIAILPITGNIIPYAGADRDGLTSSADLPPSTNPDDTAAFLRSVTYDSTILGVLARIDSYGGTPVASEIIANDLKYFPLPVAAVIREAGLSGGYFIASAADTIIASPLSDVGSIGITMSYVDNVAKNTKEGLQFVGLSSGVYKDSGDPNKPLSKEERAIFERDLKILHDQFVKEVADNRKLSFESVAKLADGSSMTGALALENKLIDALGDQETARAWFATELNLKPEEVVFCE